jgi:branched-chain amino acid transport system substrate-binding protein
MARLTTGMAAALLALLSGTAGAEELRIGFINTFSGQSAVVGAAQRNGFMLGLESEGWKQDGDKLGGVPMKLFTADDQQKPELGLQAAQKMIKSDDVQIVAGVFWSNVLAAVVRPVVDAHRIMLTTNAGSSQTAGVHCSRYFISTSFSNDQFSEALGKLMANEGVKSTFVLAPNFQAGKDMIAGFKRTYKQADIAGEALFKPGESDYQPYISQIRAAKAQAVFVFAPGGMGISFMRQWAAAGMQAKVYSVGTVDWVTLPPIGPAAIGTYHTSPYDPTATANVNQDFVKAYQQKFNATPDFYSSDAYDAARLIAAAVRKTGGRVSDTLALAKAMRDIPFTSVRGPFKFNVNGVPIQNWYKREVVKGADGKPTIVTTGVVLADQKDPYWQQCPAAERYPAN